MVRFLLVLLSIFMLLVPTAANARTHYPCGAFTVSRIMTKDFVISRWKVVCSAPGGYRIYLNQNVGMSVPYKTLLISDTPKITDVVTKVSKYDHATKDYVIEGLP